MNEFHYSSIKPEENEMTTLMHLHVHNHIMVGNNKTKDVQFYKEVMVTVQSLGGEEIF